MANVVMTGALSWLLPIPHATWLDTLQRRIPERYRNANLEAFAAGRAAVSETMRAAGT
jgi:Pyruvate/2-oxoacid:ferredoxin oxidoreductase gamma subunit